MIAPGVHHALRQPGLRVFDDVWGIFIDGFASIMSPLPMVVAAPVI